MMTGVTVARKESRQMTRPGYWVLNGGNWLGGVRPSPGAAMLESDGDLMKSGASAPSVVAAPGDGRTPITLPSVVTDPLQPGLGGIQSREIACETASTTRSGLMPVMQRKSMGQTRRKQGEHGALDWSN